MGNKSTSSKMAHTASKALQDGRTSAATKALAASVLAQTGDKSSTSNKISSLASDVLSNSNSSPTAKSLAASDLSQSK
jgi:hypothetical protein